MTYILYSLTWATLMSPGMDETRVFGYIYIYLYTYIYKYHYNITTIPLLVFDVFFFHMSKKV